MDNASQRQSLVTGFIESIRECMPNSAPVREALTFTRLVLQHPNPPVDFRKLHASLWELLNMDSSIPELAADSLRRASDHVLRDCDNTCSGQMLEMALRTLSLRFDNRPSETMLCVDLAMMAAGIAVIGIDDAVPKWTPIPVTGPMSPGIVHEWVREHVTELCERAFNCAGRGDAFKDWSASDLECSLLALRMNYCLFETSVDGWKAEPVDLLVDFDTKGMLLWLDLEKELRARPKLTASSPSQTDLSWHAVTRFQMRRAIGAVQAPVPTSDADEAGTEAGMRIVGRGSPTTVLAPSHLAGPTLVVCRSPIVGSADKQDKEEIERHRVLERPLRLAPMPRADRLLEMQQTLLAEFPWGAEVLSTVFGDLIGRAKMGAQQFAFPPTLLVGAPGSGKSRLVRRLADEFALPTMHMSLGGVSDTKVLSGTARGWGSSKPSDLATMMALRSSASVLVLLDELDKAHDGNGIGGIGLQSYLLGFMEPETASRLRDSFLKTECNFSGVTWLGTSNTLRGVHAPLLSRLRVLLLRQPSVEHFRVIGENVIAEMAKSWTLHRQVLPSLSELSLPWDHLESARQIRKAVETAVLNWAKDVQRH